MKASKFFSGLAVILFAAIGAFATANNANFAPVFYQSGSQCLAGTATICGPIGAPDCETLVVPANGDPNLITQIFETQQTSSLCADPYDRP